jgi:hypothetical protein
MSNSMVVLLIAVTCALLSVAALVASGAGDRAESYRVFLIASTIVIASATIGVAIEKNKKS